MAVTVIRDRVAARDENDGDRASRLLHRLRCRVAIGQDHVRQSPGLEEFSLNDKPLGRSGLRVGPFAFGAAGILLVAPMRGHTQLADLVHFAGTDLQFDALLARPEKKSL